MFSSMSWILVESSPACLDKPERKGRDRKWVSELFLMSDRLRDGPGGWRWHNCKRTGRLLMGCYCPLTCSVLDKSEWARLSSKLSQLKSLVKTGAVWRKKILSLSALGKFGRKRAVFASDDGF